MKDKLNIAVLFGGQSSEHEVSCVSAVTVISAIDRGKYDLILIGITKDGRWIQTEDIEAIKNGSWKNGDTRAVISPEAAKHSVMLLKDNKVTMQKIDVVFPVLHGMYGEDGTVQGIFELAKIPYVGCGVLASSVSMDKVYTKIIVDALGIRQAAYVLIYQSDLDDLESCVRKVEAQLDYPVFVKPSKAGSSQGISKAKDRAGLKEALLIAGSHDLKILVEETITGRELECAVLGGYEPEASGVGEILPADDFYTYDAKYNNEDSRTDLHPELPEGIMEKVREAALKIFKAVDGFGLSRVDFFLETGSNDVVFNEINTLPGFTSISMYPMLWEDLGIDNKQLVERLIHSASLRYAD